MEERINLIGEHITGLLALEAQLPDLRREIHHFAGLSAGLVMAMERTVDGRIPTGIRRHISITVPETLTLLNHMAGLQSGGIQAESFLGAKDLLASRARTIEHALLRHEEMRLLFIEPDLKTKLDTFNAEAALRAFKSGGLLSSSRDERLPGQSQLALFLDYEADDLPEDERKECASRIEKNEILKRYSHDQLLALFKLRGILQRIDGYGYGVARRRRPLFSKARRAVIWSAPRIGIIMASHVPSWHREPVIDQVLLDLKRYEQHMRDMSTIPDDDDYFCESDPLVRAAHADAYRIYRATQGIVRRVSEGKSAFRFNKAFFDINPNNNWNQTSAFMEQANVITNAMAVTGIGGRGERDRALAPEVVDEMERAERDDRGGLLGTLASLIGR